MEEVSVIASEGGLRWLAATNLIIWTGLFLYLLWLERKIDKKEHEQ